MVQTAEAWAATTLPKARGAANLDMHSRAIDTVEQFVVFSSLMTAFGNFGAAVLVSLSVAWLMLHKSIVVKSLHTAGASTT